VCKLLFPQDNPPDAAYFAPPFEKENFFSPQSASQMRKRNPPFYGKWKVLKLLLAFFPLDSEKHYSLKAPLAADWWRFVGPLWQRRALPDPTFVTRKETRFSWHQFPPLMSFVC